MTIPSPSSGRPTPQVLEDLYNRITGDEDARVCKDIPESACHHQPRNFFAYLGANLLGKVADEIASAKLVIPWLFGTLGVPAVFTGLLVPIREAGVLVPQLAVAAAVRGLAIRKGVWLLGAVLSAASLFAMAVAALTLEGTRAGWAILMPMVIFSLARGLCSVSAKDVLGKTVSKSRRGALMGWSAAPSGLAVLVIGLGWAPWIPRPPGSGSSPHCLPEAVRCGSSPASSSPRSASSPAPPRAGATRSPSPWPSLPSCGTIYPFAAT